MLDRLTVWHAAALALAARLAALALLPDQGFVDAIGYVEIGDELFRTGRIGSHFAMPLYPILVHLTGGEVGTRLVDIALSVASVFLIHRLAIAVFEDRRAATVAALIAAVWPHFVYFSVTGLSETFFIFLVLAAMVLLYGGRYFWGSVAVVLSILTRPALDPLAPVLILAFALLVNRERPGRAVLRLGQYALVYVVLMAPWWAHNYAKYDTFVRLNLAAGDVLYRGNNPLNTSGGGVGGEEARDVDFDLSAFARYRDPVARDAAMRGAAFEFIRDNPGRFVELAGVKFLRLWRPWPYAKAFQSPQLIAISLASYVPVMGLALYFVVVLVWRRFWYLAPILGMLAYLTLVHMATIGSVRYRVPMEPFVILFASAAAARLAARFPWLAGRSPPGPPA